MSYDALWYIVAKNNGNMGYEPITARSSLQSAIDEMESIRQEEVCNYEDCIQRLGYCTAFEAEPCYQVFEAAVRYYPQATVGVPKYDDE